MRTLVLALALMLVGATSADAALTTENCLAKKRQAQGKFQQATKAGVAFHCDWRLPTLDELQTILLAPPPCNGFSV
jgi:hypothetical protein